MFSYVAKSLLSKTLKTFLRKYLENIELESIDYGSSSSTAGGVNSGKSQHTTGSSSGWGVRLSNVKLREGMELVKLPGKRKRIIKKKKRTKNKNSKKNSISVDNDSTPITKNSKRVIQFEGNSESCQHNENSDKIADIHVASTVIDGEKGGVILNDTIKTPSLPLHENIPNRERVTSIDTENGYFSSAPSTPTQSGICGVPSTFCLNGNASRRRAADYQTEHVEAVNKVSIPYLDGEDSNGNQQLNGNAESTITPNDVEVDTVRKDGTMQGKDNLTETNECKSYESSTDEYEDIDDDTDSYIEEEDETVVEDDMALVVGAGGAIGTLNIRLVGKELHVTVEDAHLVVEAVPSESISDEKGNGATKSENPSNIDRSTSSFSEADMPTSMDDNETEPTIGEKVKKKSRMAKYLSMIPHLFLRDCKVSLILPPEEVGDDESTNDESIDECTIFELGIDFLSVTSGDDFLDTLRFDTGNSRGTPISKSRRRSSVASETPSSNSERERLSVLNNHNNVFARKRIRTGKGPDGGIWLKIQPPHRKMTQPHRVRHPNEPKWARQKFVNSSESFFLRFSGLDLHARMLTHLEDEVEIGNIWSNEYEDYTMDSMLFGVDYVDPISLTRHQIKQNMRRDRQLSKSLTDTDTDEQPPDVVGGTDLNGIESIPFSSSFHWIAKRDHLCDCAHRHLQLNDCFHCWEECVQQKTSSSSSMDNLMPMPGFVFCLSITDPLEVNVDRNSLEAIGYIMSFFTPKKDTIDDDEQENDQHKSHINSTKRDTYKDDGASDASPFIFDEESFPSFMQPDCIYLSGLHVSQVIIRLEAIQPTTSSNLNFRFWQFVGQSIHVEETQVDADEQFSRDVTFYVGKIEAQDFSGVCKKNLIMAGINEEHHGCEGEVVHLQCTASRVLGVSYPTLPEKTCAVHARLIQSDFPNGPVGEEAASAASRVGYVNIKMGIVDVDMDNNLINDATKMSHEAISILFGGSKKKKNKKKSVPKEDSIRSLKWLYQLSTVGGSLSYQPRIKMNIPNGTFRIRKGSEGFSFETLLNRLGIEYGSYTFNQLTAPSIVPLCSLPESLRMHILLYLDDLSSLEKVLTIKSKKKSSAFLRSHAVNKQLTKLGASSSLKMKLPCQTEASRRKNALSRLHGLDTDSLERLLSMHNRSHEK